MFSSTNHINPFSHLSSASSSASFHPPPPPPPPPSFGSDGVRLYYQQLTNTDPVAAPIIATNDCQLPAEALWKEGGAGGLGGAVKRAAKKDRHSKICTAQGVRDRRVRLSIQIARQFFDLQDMLGFNQASKTLEWLLANSKNAINELAKMMNVDPPGQQEESQSVEKKLQKDTCVSVVGKGSRADAKVRTRERTVRSKICRSKKIHEWRNWPDHQPNYQMYDEPAGVEDPIAMIKSRKVKPTTPISDYNQQDAYFYDLPQKWDANCGMNGSF